MAADITALWHAAAPPPPPPRSGSNGSMSQDTTSTPPPPRAASRMALERVLTSFTNRYDIGASSQKGSMIPSSSSSSVSYDADARGDSLPVDTYSPEPPRPRSRASSVVTDAYRPVSPQPATPVYHAPTSPAPHQHYAPPQHYAEPPQAAPSSPMHQVPWPTSQDSGYHAYPQAYGQAPMYTQGHAGPSFHPSPSSPMPPSPVPAPPRSRSPRPMSLPSAPNPPVQPPRTPAMAAMTANHPPHRPSSIASSSSPPLSPSRTVRRSLPQPPGSATPVHPPASTFTAGGSTGAAHAGVASSSSRTSSPTTPTSPVLPASPHRSNSTASSASTLSRSESVRMAAEELMSKGAPRRGGIGGGRGPPGRFANRFAAPRSSPLAGSSSMTAGVAASESDAAVAQQAAMREGGVQSSQSEPTRMMADGHQGVGHDSVSSLTDAFARQGNLVDSQSAAAAAAAAAAAVPPALAMPSSSTDPVPRPASRGSRDDVMRAGGHRAPPQVAVAPPSPPTIAVSADDMQSAAPPTSAGHGPGLAPASTIPRFRSPPPNVAHPVDPTLRNGAAPGAGAPSISVSAVEEQPRSRPPVVAAQLPPPPSFSFSSPEEGVAGSSAAPMINVSGPEDGAAPMISVSDEQATSPSYHQHHAHSRTASSQPHVSLHSDQGQAQRATATTTSDVCSSSHGHGYGPPPACSTHPVPATTANTAHKSASSVAGLICASSTCLKYIAGRVLSAGPALGYYHPACFRCSHCAEPLEHVAFYEHEGKAYCHLDYYELWARRCFHCRTPIVDERFIRVDDPDLGRTTGAAAAAGAKDQQQQQETTRYYHDLHFFCANCGDPFLDPKAAANGHSNDGSAVCKPFLVHRGYPYCSPCHDRLHLPHCRGCEGVIRPEEEMLTFNPGASRSAAAKGKGAGVSRPRGDKWHERCLRCSRCGGSFAGAGEEGAGSIFVNDEGDVFDAECYAIWLRGQV